MTMTNNDDVDVDTVNTLIAARYCYSVFLNFKNTDPQTQTNEKSPKNLVIRSCNMSF